MTTQNTLDAKPSTFEDTVFKNGFDHVLATSRRVTTGRRGQRRDEDAVKIDGQQKRLACYYFPFILFSALHTAFSITAKGCSSLSI